MRLQEPPETLDVVVTEAHLRRGLVDAASHFAGSKAVRRARLAARRAARASSRPATSEADDLGGFGVVDPTGMLLTASLLLGEGLKRRSASRTLERAVGTAVAPQRLRAAADAQRSPTP